MLPKNRKPEGNLLEEVALVKALQRTAVLSDELAELYRQRWPDDDSGLLFDCEGVLFSILMALRCFEDHLVGGLDQCENHIHPSIDAVESRIRRYFRDNDN